MKLKDMYDFVIKAGIESDPRGKKSVDADIQRLKRQYEKLSSNEKEEFDVERLCNPYSDTRILYEGKDKNINTILVGIDVEVGEMLVAETLIRKGREVDLVISHHPEGKALAGFYEVMHMQVNILQRVGIPITIAEDLLSERISEVERKVIAINHARTVDIAKLLNIPFMCIHTPADNHVASYLQEIMDKKSPETVGDVIDILRTIPEYKKAMEEKAGPRIIIGNNNRRAGKVFVDMTGGTEGAKDIFEKLSNAGVGTLVSMHLSEEHFRKVKNAHINVIIAGHISSDNLGLNLLLDKLSKKSKLEILEFSGFRRVPRKTT